MIPFTNYYTEQVQPKGAFKHLAPELQPVRIPKTKINKLKDAVIKKFDNLGSIFIPNPILKSPEKETYGDLDVVIAPTKTNWQEIIKSDKNTVSFVKNGNQLMITSKILNDGNQYMIDFLSTTAEGFTNSMYYYKFGAAFPVALGSFAKSLGYKWGANGLSFPFPDNRNNIHNIQLAADINQVFDILMLDKTVLDNDYLFTPKNIADWITNSPRFDSELWNSRKTFSSDTHKTIRERTEVSETFDHINKVTKKATFQNRNFQIERKILGDDFIVSVLEDMKYFIQKSRQVLTGSEIIEILHIPPGPEVGKWIYYLNNHPLFVNLTQDQLDMPETKQKAKEFLLDTPQAVKTIF